VFVSGHFALTLKLLRLAGPKHESPSVGEG
jgi:hypothetical protein